MSFTENDEIFYSQFGVEYVLDFCDAAALILSTVFYLLKQVAYLSLVS